ncbi:MAG TPA: hypothetical protein VLH75_19800 [Longimicrobiales bacterium]|nr:hypothetical protein [Longimicrobiales bacterium]
MTGDPHAPLPAPRPSALAERRFRDDEVAAILARAASQETCTDLPAPHDPTLADLMAAAADAGLDPAEVRRAAALVPSPAGGFAGAALGAPDRREAAVVLEGVSLPSDTRSLAREAARVAGRRGRVITAEPGHFLWEERHLGGGTTVSLVEEAGALEVRVSADRAGHYAGLWLGGLVGWALLSALTPLGALPLAGQVLAFLATPILLARPFWTLSDRKVRARLERAVLDLARAAEEGGRPRLSDPS